MASDKMQSKLCERISELEKENGELRKKCSNYAAKLEHFLRDEEISFLNCNPRSRLEILEENEKMKSQIEKMKCCDNCKYYDSIEKSFGYPCKMEKHYTKPCDEWELAE